MKADKDGSSGSGKQNPELPMNGRIRLGLPTVGFRRIPTSASSPTFAADDGVKFYPDFVILFKSDTYTRTTFVYPYQLVTALKQTLMTLTDRVVTLFVQIGVLSIG
jgi:hypothetical protein